MPKVNFNPNRAKLLNVMKERLTQKVEEQARAKGLSRKTKIIKFGNYGKIEIHRKEKRKWYIKEFYLKPNYRKLKIGKIMLKYLEDHAKKNGIEELYMAVKEQYIIDFLRENGYEIKNLATSSGSILRKKI